MQCREFQCSCMQISDLTASPVCMVEAASLQVLKGRRKLPRDLQEHESFHIPLLGGQSGKTLLLCTAVSAIPFSRQKRALMTCLRIVIGKTFMH